MAKFLLLTLHNLLFPFALCFMAPGALKKMKARGGSFRDLWQRFGYFSTRQLQQLQRMRERGRVFWVHAASVGEVGIAAKLIREMLKNHQSGQTPLQFVLTTTTPTGYAQVQAIPEAREGPDQAILPLYSALDGWFIVRRFLNAIRPQQLVLIEAEVWPNLTHACLKRNIPVSLVNARLSPRSERRFRRFQPFTGAVFQMLHQVMVQEKEDVQRWQDLGAAPERIRYTGSIKFDPGSQGQNRPEEQIAAFASILGQIGWQSEDPVLLLASTHAGEELALANVYRNLREQHSLANLRLIIVPRHVERSDELQKQLAEDGFHVNRRSQIQSEATTNSSILLVDTTGELRAWQYLASMVVVGKSFLAHGGQNPAEAIMAGKPVVFGPNMENFSALVDQLRKHEGAIQCANLAELEATLANLFRNPEQAARFAQNGLNALQTHEGATHKTAVWLLQ